ncbi:hypothetical protein BEE12_16035 [Pantoea agglomerans]|uniref:hypothetical protein n=1 Tax=Enterobacter agglomerans TaxID=549 RepID=UPI00083D433A|nr:hypothetical protein [Pantoea agglomerans]AOE41228.1 hypothetical protein BEE12_16035 [Pantoea agglomerans]
MFQLDRLLTVYAGTNNGNTGGRSGQAGGGVGGSTGGAGGSAGGPSSNAGSRGNSGSSSKSSTTSSGSNSNSSLSHLSLTGPDGSMGPPGYAWDSSAAGSIGENPETGAAAIAKGAWRNVGTAITNQLANQGGTSPNGNGGGSGSAGGGGTQTAQQLSTAELQKLIASNQKNLANFRGNGFQKAIQQAFLDSLVKEMATRQPGAPAAQPAAQQPAQPATSAPAQQTPGPAEAEAIAAAAGSPVAAQSAADQQWQQLQATAAELKARSDQLMQQLSEQAAAAASRPSATEEVAAIYARNELQKQQQEAQRQAEEAAAAAEQARQNAEQVAAAQAAAQAAQEQQAQQRTSELASAKSYEDSQAAIQQYQLAAADYAAGKTNTPPEKPAGLDQAWQPYADRIEQVVNKTTTDAQAKAAAEQAAKAQAEAAAEQQRQAEALARTQAAAAAAAALAAQDSADQKALTTARDALGDVANAFATGDPDAINKALANATSLRDSATPFAQSQIDSAIQQATDSGMRQQQAMQQAQQAQQIAQQTIQQHLEAEQQSASAQQQAMSQSRQEWAQQIAADNATAQQQPSLASEIGHVIKQAARSIINRVEGSQGSTSQPVNAPDSQPVVISGQPQKQIDPTAQAPAQQTSQGNDRQSAVTLKQVAQQLSANRVSSQQQSAPVAVQAGQPIVISGQPQKQIDPTAQAVKPATQPDSQQGGTLSKIIQAINPISAAHAAEVTPNIGQPVSAENGTPQIVSPTLGHPVTITNQPNLANLSLTSPQGETAPPGYAWNSSLPAVIEGSPTAGRWEKVGTQITNQLAGTVPTPGMGGNAGTGEGTGNGQAGQQGTGKATSGTGAGAAAGTETAISAPTTIIKNGNGGGQGGKGGAGGTVSGIGYGTTTGTQPGSPTPINVGTPTHVRNNFQPTTVINTPQETAVQKAAREQYMAELEEIRKADGGNSGNGNSAGTGTTGTTGTGTGNGTGTTQGAATSTGGAPISAATGTVITPEQQAANHAEAQRMGGYDDRTDAQKIGAILKDFVKGTAAGGPALGAGYAALQALADYDNGRGAGSSFQTAGQPAPSKTPGALGAFGAGFIGGTLATGNPLGGVVGGIAAALKNTGALDNVNIPGYNPLTGQSVSNNIGTGQSTPIGGAGTGTGTASGPGGALGETLVNGVWVGNGNGGGNGKGNGAGTGSGGAGAGTGGGIGGNSGNSNALAGRLNAGESGFNSFADELRARNKNNLLATGATGSGTSLMQRVGATQGAKGGLTGRVYSPLQTAVQSLYRSNPW